MEAFESRPTSSAGDMVVECSADDVECPPPPQVGPDDVSRTTAANIRARFGLSRTWNVEDREAVRGVHEGKLEEWKDEVGADQNTSLDEINGFLPSIQRLLDQGYCITDVGDMLGVTREAVRQWCNKYDLDRSSAPKGSSFRVWDEHLGRFRAATEQEMTARVVQNYVKRLRRRRRDIMHARMRADLDAVWLAKTSGEPYMVRVAKFRGQRYQSILGRWADIEEESYKVGAKRLYATAGVDKPKIGKWIRDAAS